MSNVPTTSLIPTYATVTEHVTKGEIQNCGGSTESRLQGAWSTKNALGSAPQIPNDLIERIQWVLWQREDGRKVPYRIDGRRASTTNPADWSEHHTVIETFESHPRQYAGIGFVFHESDPFVGIDLDDCLEDTTGDPKACIQAMLERFSDTYIEISPSGLGLKIWCVGKLPRSIQVALDDGCALEMYDHARYFTVTGHVFRHAPLQIEDHGTDLIALFDHLNSGNATDGKGVRYPILPTGRIPYGSQHSTLVRLAGALRCRGVCDQAIEACLQEVNRRQCERPGPEKNISRIVYSTRPWGQR
jgi:hypothetical protein